MCRQPFPYQKWCNFWLAGHTTGTPNRKNPVPSFSGEPLAKDVLRELQKSRNVDNLIRPSLRTQRELEVWCWQTPRGSHRIWRTGRMYAPFSIIQTGI